MKNLSNFEAFKMNKVQMNAITGGGIYCSDGEGKRDAVFHNVTLEQAQIAAEAAFGGRAVCEVEI
ncbi:hypothetical protein [Bacteroides sp.]|uniref:hypothetical protein n=1 Tax=Bacteroides sp. TaxID=29523 RepID=UPI003AB1F161